MGQGADAVARFQHPRLWQHRGVSGRAAGPKRRSPAEAWGEVQERCGRGTGAGMGVVREREWCGTGAGMVRQRQESGRGSGCGAGAVR